MTSLFEIRASLRTLGFTPRQVSVYLFGLKSGPSPVAAYAHAVKVNRQHMYAELERLTEMGAMERTGLRPKRYFSVSPDQLWQQAEAREQERAQQLKAFESILPDLRGLQSTSTGTSPIITSYQGLDRIRRAYERELKEAKGQEVCSIVGSLEVNYALLPESYWNTWNKTFAAQKSSARMLAHPSPATERARLVDRLARRETRILAPFHTTMNIDIFGHNVLLVSCPEQTAWWLESTAIATSYRVLFEALWRTAK